MQFAGENAECMVTKQLCDQCHECHRSAVLSHLFNSHLPGKLPGLLSNRCNGLLGKGPRPQEVPWKLLDMSDLDLLSVLSMTVHSASLR
jgi:hypothetical protein